jgi:hypothetical protein
MPTDLENLQTRRSAIVAELAALTGESAGGKPSYSIDGQQVDHTAYRLSLYEELERLDRLIAAANGPFEVAVRGMT